MPRIHTGFAGILASCVLILCAIPAYAQSQEKPVLVDPSQLMPGIQFKNAKGNILKFDPASHKLNIIHFWATWCVPCVKELPEINAAIQTYKSRGFNVVAISLDGDKSMDKVVKFLADNHIDHLTPYLDDGTTSFKAAQAKGLPTTLFVDRKGTILSRSDGPLDWNSDATKAFIEYQLQQP